MYTSQPKKLIIINIRDILRKYTMKTIGFPNRIYTVNPYQMATANGRYYLIGNLDYFDNVANYRIDRIADIHLLDTPAKNQDQVKGLEHGLDLSQHMAEHIYLFSGESVRVKFQARKSILNDLEDWFGSAAKYSNETETTVDATVRVNKTAMLHWAIQYAPYVEVLEPADLREQIRQALQSAVVKYNKEDNLE